MTDVSKQTGVGRTIFLTEPQKQQIYDTAWAIAADIGMKVHHEEGEALMLAGGCTRDDAGLVHVPAELVRRARATVPASFCATTARASRPWRSGAETPTTRRSSRRR